MEVGLLECHFRTIPCLCTCSYNMNNRLNMLILVRRILQIAHSPVHLHKKGSQADQPLRIKGMVVALVVRMLGMLAVLVAHK